MQEWEEDIMIDNRVALPGLKEVLKTIQPEDLLELSRMLEMFDEYRVRDGKVNYNYDNDNFVFDHTPEEADLERQRDENIEEGVEFIITQLDDQTWQVKKTGKKILVQPEILLTASKKELIDVFVYICRNKVDERVGDEDYWLESGDKIYMELRDEFHNNQKLQDFQQESHTFFDKFLKFFLIFNYPEEYDYTENDDGTRALRFAGIPLPGLDHLYSSSVARKFMADIYYVQFGRWRQCQEEEVV